MLGAIGSFLGGAGALLGGLGVGKDKAPAQPTMEEQYRAKEGHERVLFQEKMQLAKDHGIHPLSVLGIPTANFSPSFSIGDTSGGTDYASVGAGINQMANAFVKPPEDKPPEVDPIQARLLDAQVRTAEAIAKKAEWDALRSEFSTQDLAAPRLLMGQPGNPPGMRKSNDVNEMERIAVAQAGISLSVLNGGTNMSLEQKVLPPHPNKLGHGALTDQAHLTVMDSKGNPTSVMNSAAINADIEKGATLTALSKVFGLERAMQITALLENENLVLGTAAASAFLARHPLGRLIKWAFPQAVKYAPAWKKGGK